MKVTYSKACKLSVILGKCAIKQLGGELFIPVIKAKAKLTAIEKEHAELEQSVLKELGFEAGQPVSMDDYNKIAKEQKKLSEQEVEVEGIDLLNEINFKSLSDENPKLTTD